MYFPASSEREPGRRPAAIQFVRNHESTAKRTVDRTGSRARTHRRCLCRSPRLPIGLSVPVHADGAAHRQRTQRDRASPGHFGVQEHGSAHDGVERPGRAGVAGGVDGWTAVRDIEDSACEVQPFNAERVAPAESAVVPCSVLVTAGSRCVREARPPEDVPARGYVSPGCP